MSNQPWNDQPTPMTDALWGAITYSVDVPTTDAVKSALVNVESIERRMRHAEALIREAKRCMFCNCIQHLTPKAGDEHRMVLDKLASHLAAAKEMDNDV